MNTLIRSIVLFAAVSTVAQSATLTLNYSYTTTNNFGFTSQSGGNASIATLVMTDRTGGGIDFSLTTHGINNFGPGQAPDNVVYLSGLFLLADDAVANSANNLDMSNWIFSNATGDQGQVSFVEFGEDESPNDYRYLIEVNFPRPISTSGGANSVLDNETITWSFTGTSGGGPSVANFAANSHPERDAGTGPAIESTLKLRGVAAQGFWGASDNVFGFNTVHVGAQTPTEPTQVPLPTAFLMLMAVGLWRTGFRVQSEDRLA